MHDDRTLDFDFDGGLKICWSQRQTNRVTATIENEIEKKIVRRKKKKKKQNNNQHIYEAKLDGNKCNCNLYTQKKKII